MKYIVITGSTRGIGYGLADSFLALGCSITVSGRSQAGVDKAVAALAAKYGADRIHGHPCDVTDFPQVQALWDAAVARFGRVDIWINNAGTSHPLSPVRELSPQTIRSVVDTNLLGVIYGSQVALNGMIEQGSGQIYSMEGYGSDGSIRSEMALAIYGTTKNAIHYFNRSLANEAKNTSVQVGWIRPGMVATDLIGQQYVGKPEELERAKKFLNLIAERAETVTPWLAQQVLANTKNGALIRYGSRAKLMLRFLLAPFVKRDIMGDLRPGGG